ncbi:MAG: ComEC/Rec2 family competence protein [Sandarakinorhabdus sp.]|nr:ComEC/Rec2 family competence protein [Sandarakinorhabdus sp.]
MAILAVRPEVLLGASFQLSFAAVMGIIALYESPLGRWLTSVPEAEHFYHRTAHFYHRTARQLAGLLASGLVAEAALSGIGLYHFGRAGLYGVLANMIAIPWTSFAVLPALALALAGEALGTAAAWPLAGWAMTQLIALADYTAGRPGAVLVLPAMPVPAFALLVAGGLWLALWRSRARWWGVAPVLAAVLMAASNRPPDLLVSGDGRHVAWRLPDGRLAFSRARVGDYLAETWSETVGGDADERLWLGDLPAARCSADACIANIVADGRRWQLLATTSRDWIDRAPFAAACASVDIVVSDRRLPAWCRPRWLKLDRTSLAHSGALALWLVPKRIVTAPAGDRPWQVRYRGPVSAGKKRQDSAQENPSPGLAGGRQKHFVDQW